MLIVFFVLVIMLFVLTGMLSFQLAVGVFFVFLSLGVQDSQRPYEQLLSRDEVDRLVVGRRGDCLGEPAL